VIKSFVILVLLLTLVVGATLSRPNKAEFESVAGPKLAEVVPPKNVIERVFGKTKTVSVLQDCEYKNRVLWTDVYLDGKHLATGAFGRWFWTDDGQVKIAPKPQE
jgi:hypothetical protein